MKITKLLPLLTIISLISCSNNNNITDVKIMTPTGAPSLAFYNFKDVKGYSFETNANPNNVVAAMNGNDNINAVVLPTNAGIQAIKGGANYKLAATITYGNFYVCATGNDSNNVMDEGDKVVVFQQNGIPDKLFKDVYSSLYSSLDITYVTAASDAAGVLKTGTVISESGTTTVDYVLVADPAMRNALANNSNASIYSNLRNEFKSKHNNMEITQASLFVKNTLNATTVKALLDKLSNDINAGLKTPSLIKEGMDKFGSATEVATIFGVGSPLVLQAQNANNGMGLGFNKAIDIKNDIDNFLSIIAPTIGVTSEEIYYK